MEEELEAETEELRESQGKVLSLEKKVAALEKEKKEAKRGFLDIGW